MCLLVGRKVRSRETTAITIAQVKKIVKVEIMIFFCNGNRSGYWKAEQSGLADRFVKEYEIHKGSNEDP